MAADYRARRLTVSSDLSQQTRGMIASRDAITLSPGFAVPEAPRMSSNIFDSASSFIKHQTVSENAGDLHLQPPRGSLWRLWLRRSSESYVGPGASTLLNAAGDVELYEIPYASMTHTRVGRLGSHLNFHTGPIQHAVTLAADAISVHGAYFYEGLDTYTPYESNIYHPIAIKPLSPRIVPFKNVPETDSN